MECHLACNSFSDQDYDDDVSLFAKLLVLLISELEMMASEAASLRLEVNWQKIKVQALAAGRMSHCQSQFNGCSS